ncbi:MAG: hypothetical protein ACRD1D_02935 [Acidimicrobiales bacterium]
MRTHHDVSIPDQVDHAAVCDLVKTLEADPRFRRDSFLGGIFHPGRTSYREISPLGSLHVLIDGDRVSAHVDDVSPLVVRADGSSGYAWGRVLAHNVLVMIGDVARRVRGGQGEQRCNLHCQVEWVDEDRVGEVGAA